MLLFTACSEDKLEIPQKGVISVESFYKTDADAESALVNAYKDFASNMHSVDGTWIYVPFNIIFNYPADNVLAAGNYYGDNDHLASINEFRFDASSDVVKNAYKRLYFIIYHSNLVIDNFKYGESAVKDRCISEARVIRAYCHMYAALAWGTPPLVEHVLKGDDKPANYSGTHEELLEWCAKECEEAAAFIPERVNQEDKNGAVKITKGFAQALQGKALLYAGDYAGAKVALKKVIDSGKYGLVSGPEWRDLFHIAGDGSKEKVFEFNLVQSADLDFMVRSTWMEANLWGWRTDKLQSKPDDQGVGGWGGLAIEETFANEFYANDGDSYRRKATMITYDEFITEIRWASDTAKTTVALKLTDPGRGIKDPGGLYGQGKFLTKKHIVTTEDLQGKN
ncbi:MAG: RagB/SusD family nutrient uptake outer membrane protein, partial [Bacteroidales bacterium]|nr:RagB/SusD family nutrient uptake outer membrane protein [Bacteroidales bacterium]